jgi:hypothetical protein
MKEWPWRLSFWLAVLAVLTLQACAMAIEARFALLYAAMTLTMLANYVLHDPGLIPWFGLAAPDAQLLNVRWANAAINMLIFGAWTAGLVIKIATQRRLPWRLQGDR